MKKSSIDMFSQDSLEDCQQETVLYEPQKLICGVFSAHTGAFIIGFFQLITAGIIACLVSENVDFKQCCSELLSNNDTLQELVPSEVYINENYICLILTFFAAFIYMGIIPITFILYLMSGIEKRSSKHIFYWVWYSWSMVGISVVLLTLPSMACPLAASLLVVNVLMQIYFINAVNKLYIEIFPQKQRVMERVIFNY